MSDTLSPKTCGPDAWKKWLKEGSHLFLRLLSGWGILWLSLFIFRGYLIKLNPVSEFLFIAFFLLLAPLIETAHLRVAFLSANGHVSIKEQLLHIFYVWGNNAWIRIIKMRFNGSLLLRLFIFYSLYVFFSSLISFSSHYFFHTPLKATSTTITSLQYWWSLLNQTAFISVYPLFCASGGITSLITPLMLNKSLSLDEAKMVAKDAYQKNPSIKKLDSLVTLIMLLCFFLTPFLSGLVELFWFCIFSRLLNDVIGDGDGLKNTASVSQEVTIYATIAA